MPEPVSHRARPTDPIFFEEWKATVGTNWLSVMTVSFSLFGFMIVLVLMWKGEALRKKMLFWDHTGAEDGVKIA